MHTSSLSEERKGFTKVVNINAPTSRVWQMLTTPQLMQKWMMQDIELDIITDWNVGNPIITRGVMNGKPFENKGIVLQFEPQKILAYSHLSSISRLPDRSESYVVFEFKLQPIEDQTRLALMLSNFPTESIYKHLVFYWNVTLELLKKQIEEQAQH